MVTPRELWEREEMEEQLLPKVRAQIKAGKLPSKPIREAEEYFHPEEQIEPCRCCGIAIAGSWRWYKLRWYARKFPPPRLRPVLHGACYDAWKIAIGAASAVTILTTFTAKKAAKRKKTSRSSGHPGRRTR